MVRARLVKRKWRRHGKVQTSLFWHLRWSEDGGPETQLNLKVHDRASAEALLVKFRQEKEREASGVIAPKPIREAAQRLLSAHLEDFISDLGARGRSRDYLYNTRKHVLKLIAECGWQYARLVTADSFQTWRAKQKGKAAKTLNEYLSYSNSFLNWLVVQGRIPLNPLLGRVGKSSVAGNQKERRAFTVDELRLLLFPDVPASVEVSENEAGPPALKPSLAANIQCSKIEPSTVPDTGGRTRDVKRNNRVLYMTAYMTGLRRNELRQLRWADVNLDDSPPFLSVRAATTKNRKAVTIPLHAVLVAELRRIRPVISMEMQKVFRRVPWMPEFRADLEAAGIDHKPDGQGRVLVFHSLRHSLATHLQKGGMASRLVMEVMRHSDIKLTTKRYTDVSQLSTGEVGGVLGGLFGSRFKVLDLRERSESVHPCVPACVPDGATEFVGFVWAYGGWLKTDNYDLFNKYWNSPELQTVDMWAAVDELKSEKTGPQGFEP